MNFKVLVRALKLLTIMKGLCLILMYAVVISLILCEVQIHDLIVSCYFGPINNSISVNFLNIVKTSF